MLDYLDGLSATEWEARGHRVAELMLQMPLRHRGQTVTGNPVGYTVDSYSWQGTWTAEFSVDRNYFVDLEKPKRDYAHARAKHPQAQVVLLMSTQLSGPGTAADVANWEHEVAQGDGVLLLVADAREIAEFIADEVVPKPSVCDTLAPHFEPLRHLESEYAASHSIPDARPGVLRRADLENELIAALDQFKVVVLAGMSGLGKSETAIAVANARGNRHDWRVWVRGPQLTSVADLQAVDVTQRGVKLNLAGMLSTRRCLVIVDDVPASIPLDQLVETLRHRCGPDSAALVTSQLSYGGPENIDMPHMEPGEARQVLEHGTLEPCPDNLCESILETVGGHPMALGMLNGSAREGLPWRAVADDAARVASLPVPERTTVLANVLLERWRSSVEDALAFFVWAESSRVYEELCRRAASYAAIRMVRRLGLLAGDQPGALRLHDIAWAATKALKPPLVPRHEDLAVVVDQYVRELSSEDAGTLALNQLARLHQSTLKRLVYSEVAREGHLYAWLHHPGPGEIRAGSLPDPVSLAKALASGAPDDFAVQTAAELAEAVLRLRLKERPGDTAGPTDDELLLPFDLLLGAERVSAVAKHHVRHHHAKALKRLKRWQEAIDACEELLRQAGPLPSTRLLLARTLTELPRAMSTPATGQRARELLLDLLEEASTAPERASVSVTLAAAELLRRNAVHADFAHVFAQYGEMLERLIVDASRRGLEQATLAFGALGAEWSRRDANGFKRVFSALPMPSADAIADWEELIAWGEVLKAAAEAAPSPERERLLEESLPFFARPRSRYAATHLADAYTQLGRPADALSVLDDLVARDAGAGTDGWVLQRRSEAYVALGNEPNALDCASRVCERLEDRNRHTPYLLKWYVTRLVAAGRRQEAEAQLDRLRAWLEAKGRGAEWDAAEAVALLNGTGC